MQKILGCPKPSDPSKPYMGWDPSRWSSHPQSNTAQVWAGCTRLELSFGRLSPYTGWFHALMMVGGNET
jgi:hypothetical protein